METPENQTAEIALCTHCAAPLQGSENFCNACGCPLTFQAASMPYESILARGFLWREGSARPQKLVVVIGIWLLFAPTLAISLLLFLGMLVESWGIARRPDPEQNIPLALLGLLLTGGAAAVSAVLLHKTTRNYLAFRQVREEEDIDDEAAEEDGQEDE